MKTQKRILILTADAGFGHRSAAIALEAALLKQYEDQVEISVVNPLEDHRAPAILRDSQTDYDTLVRKAPELYRLGYTASDTTISVALIESALTVMLFEVILETLRKFRPHAILCTYPLYQSPLAAIFSIFKIKIPVITIVTDLVTVHGIWFNQNIHKLLVPTAQVADLAVGAGVPGEKIEITGIPVHPTIADKNKSKTSIRKKLGWNPRLLTVLAVGSKRVAGLPEAINVINHFGFPLQLVVICGKDSQTYTELSHVDWHIPVHLYEYVTDMPTYMLASDFILCKAGGLIVTESLACGLPMLLMDVIQGQETGNMEFVVENGAGLLVDDPIKVLEALKHLTQDNRIHLREMAKNAKAVGRPKAALRAAEIAWEAAQLRPAAHEGPTRKTLVDLLTNNQVILDQDQPLELED